MISARLRIRKLGESRSALAHPLGLPLVVSLTSYPPRFGNLRLTLLSLLSQDMKPDAVYLWIAEADQDSLPEDIKELQYVGLTIKYCEDYRSFKKIVPLLKSGLRCVTVIADDDVYYPQAWLRQLVSAWNGRSSQAVCHRAHEITLNEADHPRAYLEWSLNIQHDCEGALVFATGVGGVLYGPDAFASEVVDVERAMSLCPSGDDIWLYWMARRAGTSFKKIGGRSNYLPWEDEDEASLAHQNVLEGGNDRQVLLMVREFGLPWSGGDSSLGEQC